MGILDGSGNSVVQYSYNAWGYPLGTTGSLAASLGTVNPLRYRGYVFDADIGLYYLESRYYNPGLCRFQSADVFASTGQGLLGNNMYIYCNNNPVNRIDPSGNASVNLDNLDITDDQISARDGGGDIGYNKVFSTFKSLKKALGSPGEGNEWHHIVEQSQISKSGFSSQMIQNTSNVVSISKSTHRLISAYYSSKQLFTGDMIVRNWLAGQSYRFQYEFGIDIINMFT